MLKFSILIDSSKQIKSMKDDLAKYFPDIKSSHLTEALARALGFSSNAALRSAVQQSPAEFYKPAMIRDVSWTSFNEYLKDKGFNPTAKPLYLAAGRASIKLAMEIYPRLTHSGNGINTQHYKGETAQEHVKRFRHERDAMLSDSAIEEFLRSYVLVSKIPATRTVTKKQGAYKLKHIAEKVNFKYPDGENSPANYVSTGSLIFAAVSAGFWYKDIEESQSVYFNMMQRAIDNLDCEVRPQQGKERKSITIKGITPLHYTQRSTEKFNVGDNAWISWNGRKALPVVITEVDNIYYTFQIEHPKKHAGNEHYLRLDEVRSTPELACLNCVTG